MQLEQSNLIYVIKEYLFNQIAKLFLERGSARERETYYPIQWKEERRIAIWIDGDRQRDWPCLIQKNWGKEREKRLHT